MYLVKLINGNSETIIHDARMASNAQKISEGKIVDAENAISSFKFTIYPRNNGYSLINPYGTLVSVFNMKRNRYDFIGRILQSSPSMDSTGLVSKEVTCEDRLGFLQDSLQPYTELTNYTDDDERTGLQKFIDVILDNHNSQVEEYKRIYRGTVDVDTHDDGNGVFKQLNWETTYDVIMKKLVDVFGGYVRLRESNGLLYLDYLTSLGSARSTTIELGKNMVSDTQNIDASGIVTRLVPLGAKLTAIDDAGNEVQTEERLTISEVNDGKSYISAEEYEEQYGIRYKTVIWDDVTVAANLLTKGIDWLESNNGIVLNHDVDAIDLSLLGMDIDDFAVYDSYPVKNSLIGLNETLRIIKKTTDVVAPYASTFEMGSIKKRLSDNMIDSMLVAQNALTEASAASTAVSNTNIVLRTYVQETMASYRVDPDQIWAAVQSKTVDKSDYDVFTEYVRNILQMNADGTTMLFQRISEAIESIGDAESSHYAELLTYIRFTADGIEIGKQGDAITMKLGNNALEFYNNGVKVAYLSDNTLFITDGRFLRSLRIGNFGFIPESNGSVSFTYLGGD